MSTPNVFYGAVEVYDDKIFTRERSHEWQQYIVAAYKSIYERMQNTIDPSCMISFYVDKALLEESITDAIIGMRKIIDSHNNSVEDPNSFKIAAYLSYWWLRHKPICVHYPIGFDARNTQVIRHPQETDDEYETRRQKTIWQLKHMNELVAVQMVMHYIFDVNTLVCKKSDCKRIIKQNKGNFCFDSFEAMYKELLGKLTYYFAYRAIAPKVIEHMLEAYTFHPA